MLITREDVKAGRVAPVVLDHVDPPVIVPPSLRINAYSLAGHQEELVRLGARPLNETEITLIHPQPSG